MESFKNLSKWVDKDPLCAQIASPELWFSDHLADQEYALTICNACPLREPCLDYAVHHMVQGIWGGTVESVRKRIRRERGIVGIQVKLTDWK